MGVVSSIDVSAKDRKTILTLLERHLPGTEVWVYGSRVKWTSRPQSDLDMVVFAAPEDERAVSDLREAFEESDLLFKVDLFVWNKVPNSFRKHIARDHVALSNGSARSTWRTVSMGDVADVLGGGTPSTKDPGHFDGDVPWLTPKDLSGVHARYVSRGARNLSQKGLVSSSAKLLPARTVLLSTRAPIGYVAIAKTPIATNQGFRSLVAKKGLHPEYLYYWLSLNTEELERHATGSTFRELSGSSLKRIQLHLPPLPEQRAIAHILGTLDDKIELSRRMNQTLEAMARAIFKDWFVDFGPVKAKMEGRAPYLPPDIWKLFPDTLDSTGKPMGWTTYALGDLAHHHRATLSPCVQPDRTYEHYSIPAYDAGREPSSDRGGSIRSNKTIVPDGAVLMSKLNPEIERVWLPNPRSTAPQIASTELLTLTPSAPATRSVLYCLFGSAPFRAEMTARVTGTSRSHQRVPPRALLACNALTAEPQLLGSFDNNVGPMLNRTISHRRESRLLEQARDLLLPKLLSGTIRTEATELVAGRKPVGHQTAQAGRS